LATSLRPTFSSGCDPVENFHRSVSISQPGHVHRHLSSLLLLFHYYSAFVRARKNNTKINEINSMNSTKRAALSASARNQNPLPHFSKID
jgi:hypothetical protein